MRKISMVLAVIATVVFSSLGMAFADGSDPTPSTNDRNRAEGWAHFNVVGSRPGEVDIEFVSTRGFWSCFEYRRDGEGPGSSPNPNPKITDGRWLSVCVKNERTVTTIDALQSLEIRMVFGAETDERFDWTPVEVVPVPGAGGLVNAKSGPAGERANENARFKEGNDNARSNR